MVGVSFFLALITGVYGDLNLKMEVFRFLIPLIVFSFALFAALTYKDTFVKKEKVIFLAVILFGLFNGIGFSSGFNFELVSYENNFTPIVGATLGVGTAVFLIILSIVALVLVLKRIVSLSNKNWLLGASLLVASCALPIVFVRMFY